jgi:hypothetical protein
MKVLKKYILPVFLATLWISFSEFFRNELLFKQIWIDHYQSLGLVFPSEPINGVIWGVWSLMFAIAIFIISTKYTFVKTAAIAWLVGFILMWIVVGNMGVLPFKILYYAVPLSILEVVGATWLIKLFR